MEDVPIAIIGAVLLLLSAGAVALGVMPMSEVLVIADRVWPILLFVLAITVVAELAALAGVFDVASAFLARVARRRVWLLWLLVVGLAILSTAFLSLDTTAVILTPIVLSFVERLKIPARPFVFACAFISNTASLLLPISNLTNLLYVGVFKQPFAAYAARMFFPQLAAVATLYLLFRWLFRRELVPTFDSSGLGDSHQAVRSESYFHLTCVVLAFWSQRARGQGKVALPDSLALGILRPAQKGLVAVGSWFSDVGRVMIRRGDILQENAELRRRVADLDNRNQRLLRYQQENRELRQMLKMPAPPNGRLLPAEVVSRDATEYARRAIINAGAPQGVRPRFMLALNSAWMVKTGSAPSMFVGAPTCPDPAI